MTAQTGCGHVMMTLRELNQLAITLTERYTSPAATAWRNQTKDAIIQLIHETVAVLRDERHSAALARNVGHRTGVGIDLSSKIGTRGSVQGARVITSGSDDPMVLVHSLRSHLYTESDRVCRKNDDSGVKIELFERCKMIDQLHEFTGEWERKPCWALRLHLHLLTRKLQSELSQPITVGVESASVPSGTNGSNFHGRLDSISSVCPHRRRFCGRLALNFHIRHTAHVWLSGA